MKVFKLPDLGEGLPDAVIREWHIQEGEHIDTHQTLVTVETAKALVEVPSPRSGTVEKLFAAPDETVQVGQPLVAFADDEGTKAPRTPGAAHGRDHPPTETTKEKPSDSATVVGKIQQTGEVLARETSPTKALRPATPSIRALARHLGVDLTNLAPKASYFTEEEIRAAAGSASPAPGPQAETSPARRAMALAMSRSRDQVAPMTLCDQVDISAWWRKDSATLRLIRAVQKACAEEPNLNATYENELLTSSKSINIGLAVDSPRGLFVPVLKNVSAHSDEELLQQIEDYKEQARETGIAREDLQGATILLSNFGALAGRYATPVVMPPAVAIVGAGRTFEGVVAANGKPSVRPLLPLSISADHRAVTGGELARFLKSLLEHLSS